MSCARSNEDRLAKKATGDGESVTALGAFSQLRQTELMSGHGAAWAALEKYVNGDAKPRSKKAQLKKIDALSAERHGADYPERRAFLVGSSKDEL